MGIIVISTKQSARRNPILTEVGFLFGESPPLTAFGRNDILFYTEKKSNAGW